MENGKSVTDLTKMLISKGGTEFCKFAGYLQEARAMGLDEIDTTWLNPDTYDKDPASPKFFYKCKVTMKDGGTYTGHGDATKNNVGKLIIPHMNRMAETRSIVRALRWATGIAITGLDELGGD